MLQFLSTLLVSYLSISLFILMFYTYMEYMGKFPLFYFNFPKEFVKKNEEVLKRLNSDYNFQKSQMVVFWLIYLLLFLRFGLIINR